MLPEPASSTAVVVSVGDELLSGDVVDTNAAWIDQRLLDFGRRVVGHWVVPDRAPAIVDAVRSAATRAPLVVITGGLGPTDDDVTLGAIAQAAGVDRVLHAATIERIEARLRERQRSLTAGHRRQAEVPRGAQVLDNPVGSAPGIALRLGTSQLFVLPGVPREMKALFEAAVVPRLGRAEQGYARRIVHTVGLPESDLEARLASVRPGYPGVTFGYRSVGREQQVRLYGADRTELSKAMDAVTRELGPHVFGRDGARLEDALCRRWTRDGIRVAVAESCTGGGLGETLTRVPGSSGFFAGGVIAYDNAVKVELLGVSAQDLEAYGAVSEPVALAMARGIRARLGVELGLATTGIAGPGGGTADKPVGTVWIAASRPNRERAICLHRTGDRDFIRRATIEGLMAELWLNNM